VKLEESESKVVYRLFEYNGEPSSKTKYNNISDSENVPWGKIRKIVILEAVRY